jgi:tRNA-dihydrouridine synthase B
LVKIGNIELGDFPLLLAPMEDVSDPPFRTFCKFFGADMVYTEFISSEGLIRNAAKSVKKLDIYENERPVGIQIFGGNLDSMIEATKVVEASSPDLIDINFGCPVKKVVSKGAGSGILKDIPKMVKLTEVVVKATRLPVTVKTRLGWDDNSKYIEEVAESLQDVGIQAISIHGRTRAQMYKGRADWTLIGKVKNNPRIKIPVFGNGDVDTPQTALEMKNKYGVDGIMIGRAAIGYPWIFREIKAYLNEGTLLPPPAMEERIDICKQHLQKSIEWKGDKLGVLEMRKHYSNYFRSYKNIKAYRLKLCTIDDKTALFDLLESMKSIAFELQG